MKGVLGRIPVERDGDWQERDAEINRAAKVVKGGWRFSFIALVVVGDETKLVRKSISEILPAGQQAGEAPAEVAG